jgi:hypothetical protein
MGQVLGLESQVISYSHIPLTVLWSRSNSSLLHSSQWKVLAVMA